jgi:large subunit ribosomal protein L17
MRRNLAQSLIEHETISTTIEKAKEVKPFVEKLITLAKKGGLPQRRRAIALLGNRQIVDLEDGRPVKKGTVVNKLFSELGPRYLDRPGGYTRIIRLSLRRLGDNGELVLLQLLGADEAISRDRKVSTKRSAGRKAAATTKAEVAPAGPQEAAEDQAAQAEAAGAVEAQAEEAAADEADKDGSEEGESEDKS